MSSLVMVTLLKYCWCTIFNIVVYNTDTYKFLDVSPDKRFLSCACPIYFAFGQTKWMSCFVLFWFSTCKRCLLVQNGWRIFLFQWIFQSFGAFFKWHRNAFQDFFWQRPMMMIRRKVLSNTIESTLFLFNLEPIYIYICFTILWFCFTDWLWYFLWVYLKHSTDFLPSAAGTHHYCSATSRGQGTRWDR